MNRRTLKTFSEIVLLSMAAAVLVSCGPDVKLDVGPNLKKLPKTTETVEKLDHESVQRAEAQKEITAPSRVFGQESRAEAPAFISNDAGQSIIFRKEISKDTNWQHFQNSKYLVISGKDLNVNSIGKYIETLNEKAIEQTKSLHSFAAPFLSEESSEILFNRPVYIYAEKFTVEENERILTNGNPLTIVALEIEVHGKVSTAPIAKSSTPSPSRSGGKLTLVAEFLRATPSADLDVSAGISAQKLDFENLTTEERGDVLNLILATQGEPASQTEAMNPLKDLTPREGTDENPYIAPEKPIVSDPERIGQILQRHAEAREMQLHRYGFNQSGKMNAIDWALELDGHRHHGYHFKVEGDELVQLERTSGRGYIEHYRVKFAGKRKGLSPTFLSQRKWSLPPIQILRNVDNQYRLYGHPGQIDVLIPGGIDGQLSVRSNRINSNSLIYYDLVLDSKKRVSIPNAAIVEIHSELKFSASEQKEPNVIITEIPESLTMEIAPPSRDEFSNSTPMTITSETFRDNQPSSQTEARSLIHPDFTNEWGRALARIKALNLPAYSPNELPFATFEKKAAAENKIRMQRQ